MWGNIAAIATVIGLLFAGYLHMFTDLEAAELIAKHEKDVNSIVQAIQERDDRTEIYRAERKIDELKERIRVNPGADILSQLEWQASIDQQRELIACIKASLSLCY
ncbi:MAG TPA: hypothetical protein VMV86_07160 [Methanosarcinales archaeon]|nr:hypothetical protein [Methanosarcinales archaeon]